MNIKKTNFSEWYNEITKEAGLCDLRYGVKGFVVFMPWSVLTMEKMYAIYEKALQKTGHLPAWFPALIPESYLTKESEHVEGFVPEVFWVTEAGKNKLEEKYAMRPTSETAMYPMYSLWIQGVKDLPLKIYQRAQVWRYETKATKPFIRSREFFWIEAHDVFATEKDAMDQVRADMRMAHEIIEGVFGVPILFLRRPQWDKFAGAVNTYAADCIMPDGRILQLPSTHMLGQNFAKPFDVKYMDEKGAYQFCWQTCYGPAISRIYAAVFATHGDDKGLVLPFELAPLQLIIVPILKKGNEQKVLGKCKELLANLEEAGFSVKLDDSETTPGFKYNHWEMKGVPIRVEVGERDIANSSVMLVRRDSGEKKSVKETELIAEIPKVAKALSENIREKSKTWFKGMLSEADTLEELKKLAETKGGLIKVPFCTDAMEGEACAEKLKDACAVNMRGSLFEDKHAPKGKKCIACGKEAEIYLYAGRQY
ncbi:MAG: proline--tRNA ligase [Candidatus Bilamarchaeaceae archaeon]